MVQVSLLASALIPAREPASVSTLITDHTEALQCDVVFGSPSADCRGTGICKITGTNASFPPSLKKECRITQAMVLSQPDSQVLTLYFYRSWLCTQLYRRHFWRGVLKMDESCPLPEALRASLNTACAEMLPGRYPVTEENGWFRVDIQCA